MRTIGLLAISGLALLALVGTASAGPLDAPGYTKSFTCSACHGFAGNSTTSTMPILAGANAAYFKKQIQSFATGKRPSPEMEPYAKMVLELGIDEVASYFAAQKRIATPVKVDPAAAARGKHSAVTCANCHGPEGKGHPAPTTDAMRLIPSVAGQAPGYLKLQIQAFRDGKRNASEPLVEEMRTIMKNLSPAAIDDIIAYYSTVK